MHKENFRDFWAQESRWEGDGYFQRWYGTAIRSQLLPVKKVAKSLKAHLEGLLAYFAHRITNAATEALNGRIAALKANARGFAASSIIGHEFFSSLANSHCAPPRKPDAIPRYFTKREKNADMSVTRPRAYTAASDKIAPEAVSSQRFMVGDPTLAWRSKAQSGEKILQVIPALHEDANFWVEKHGAKSEREQPEAKHVVTLALLRFSVQK